MSVENVQFLDPNIDQYLIFQGFLNDNQDDRDEIFIWNQQNRAKGS